MKHIIFIFGLFIFCDCGHQMSNNKNNTVTYKELEKGFYLGSDNNLYIKTAEQLDAEKADGAGTPFYRKIPNLDVATFENLGHGGWYAKDKKNVFIDNEMTDGRHISLLENADASTFQCFGYRWGKDKNHVFENGIILEGLNPDSMIILCPDTAENNFVFFSFVKDNNQVFYCNQEMMGVDASTFECNKSGSSVVYQDKNWIYKENYFPNMDKNNKIKRSKR